METSKWRPRPTLNDLINERGPEFELYQLIRLVQRLHPDKVPIGHFGPSDQEAVRLYGAHELASPHGSVSSVATKPPYKREEESPVPLHVRAPSGLTDAYNPCSLPMVYIEQIRKALDMDHNPAQAEFIDLFNHRLLSLEYRGWEKSRFYIRFERSPDAERNRQTLSFWLYSLMGSGVEALAARLHVPDRFLLRYSGFFVTSARPAQSLASLLSDFFGITAEVQEFQGQWCSVPEADRACLSPEARRLRDGSCLGDKTWYQQSSVRVCLGPMTIADFQTFLPGTSRFGDLIELVNHYTRSAFEDFEIELRLRAEDVPPCRLATGSVSTRLGWLTWIGNRRASDHSSQPRSVMFSSTDPEAKLRHWVQQTLINMNKRLQSRGRLQLAWSEDVISTLMAACGRMRSIRSEVVATVTAIVWNKIASMSKDRQDHPGSIEIAVKEGHLAFQVGQI
jgi:type VI secretion system protein ImpH